MMRYIHILLIFIAVLSVSCRKELHDPLNNNGEIELRLAVDWSQIEYDPQEMSIVFFPLDGGKPHMRYFTKDNPVIEIYKGAYSVLIFNDDSDMIKFRGIDHYETFEAYIITSDPDSYGKSEIIEHADKLYVYSIDSMSVVDIKTKAPQQEIACTPKNVIVSLGIDMPVQSIENAKAARGTLAGVASSIFMHDQEVVKESPKTVAFDVTLTETGVTTSIGVFGIVPHDAEAPPEGQTVPNVLKLQFLLKDDTVVEHSVDLSGSLNDDIISGGGNLPLEDQEVEMPELRPGGGFNPDEDDWGDEEEIPLSDSKEMAIKQKTNIHNLFTN